MATPSRGGVSGTSFDQLVPVSIGAGAPDKPRGPVLYDSKGTAWFPAGEPIPVQVQNVEPRILDFPTFWNRQTIGSAKQRDSGVTFAQLRALSKQTHVRVVIETVKDRQSKVEWTFALKPKRGERPRETQKRTREDPRIDQLEAFFAQPEQEHDWTDWLRNLLEQSLVCDNLSILQREYEFAEARAAFYGEGNQPPAIEILNGDTIFRVIDDTGRTPMPPDVAYQQWIHGVVVDEFTTDQLLYAPRNVSSDRIFGLSPVEQLLFYINMILRRDVTKLDFYTKGNMPAGFMPIPKDWSPDKTRQFIDWLTIELAGNQENRAKIWPIPGDVGQVQYPQKEMLQDTFDDAWLRLVCFCFSIPVSSLVREQLRSTADNSKQQATEEGEQVLTHWLGKLQNRIIRKWFGWTDVYAIPKAQLEVDAAKRSEIEDRKLRNGTLQPDEVREQDGRDPFNLPPGMVTATGFVLLPTPEQIEEQKQKDEADRQAQSEKNRAMVAVGGNQQPDDPAKGVKKNSLEKSNDATLELILRFILGDDPELQRLARLFHEDVVELGAEQIADLLDSDAGPIAIDDPRVIAFLEQRENRIVSVNKTTGDLVIDAIREGVNEGDTPEAIERRIRDAFDLRAEQSENIADTEIGSALNFGRFTQMDEEGADDHWWLSSRDGAVRPSHAPQTGVDGETVALGEPFSNGLLYPQDPDGDADEVCNCRCISMPGFAKLSKSSAHDAHWRRAMRQSGKYKKRMSTELRGYFEKQANRISSIYRSVAG